jgi:hypothetical protein
MRNYSGVNFERINRLLRMRKRLAGGPSASLRSEIVQCSGHTWPASFEACEVYPRATLCADLVAVVTGRLLKVTPPPARSAARNP